MSGHCKDCKWWEKQDWRYEDLNVCALTETEYGEAKSAGTLAQAIDYEIYYAVLVTTPDFGCVQFEAREGENNRE